MKSTSRSKWALMGRLGLLGGAGLALVASTQEGDRAADGACPAGETCSDLTPEGLLFEGAPLAVWPALSAHTIAAGGRQGFRILDKATDRPFEQPFVASVTTAAHHVIASGGDRVVVAADAAAFGHLRIASPEGELYDRLEIASEEITAVRVAPAYAAAYPFVDPPSWAAYAGGTAAVAVVLSSADDEWLVDENLTVRAPFDVVRSGWDSFAVRPDAVGIAELAVDAGHVVDRRASFAVVDGFDEVEILAPTTTGIGGDVAVCFTAWRGSGAEARAQVIGVPWEFHVTGPATPRSSQRYLSCLELHTDGGGEVQVTASAGGESWTAVIGVRGASARWANGLAGLAWAPSEGERARASDAALAGP